MRSLGITHIKDFNLILPTLLSLQGDSLEAIELHVDISPEDSDLFVEMLALPAGLQGLQSLNDVVAHQRLSGVKSLKLTVVMDREWGIFGVGSFSYELKRHIKQEVTGWDSRWEITCVTKNEYDSL